MELRQSDFDSVTWERFKTDAEQRLESLRRRNDGDLDPLQTARLRGQIAELKHWLALDNPTPTLEPPRPE